MSFTSGRVVEQANLMMVDAFNAFLLRWEWRERTIVVFLLVKVFRAALHSATVEMVNTLTLVARSVHLQSLDTYILQQQHVQDMLDRLEVYGLLLTASDKG